TRVAHFQPVQPRRNHPLQYRATPELTRVCQDGQSASLVYQFAGLTQCNELLVHECRPACTEPLVERLAKIAYVAVLYEHCCNVRPAARGTDRIVQNSLELHRKPELGEAFHYA